MNIRPYLSHFRMRYIHGFQYRAAAWAGVFTQFCWGFLEILLYRAFYVSNPERFPMAFTALTSYIWLRQALLALLNTWSFEEELFDSIRSGNIAYELCRPASLYGMWFSRNAGLRASRATMRFFPILVIASCLPSPYGITLPASLSAAAEFLVSLALALAVSVAQTLIVYFCCFYTTGSEGVRMFYGQIADFLSGALIPLPMMPDAVRRVAECLPFGATVNAPLRIYSGDIAGAETMGYIGLQAFWLVILVLIGWAIQKRGMKRLEIQGG